MLETIGEFEFETFDRPSGLIDRVAEKFDSRNAVKFYRGNQIVQKTYSEMQKNIKQLAAHLSQIVQPQQQEALKPRVCVIGDASYEWIVSFYGIMYAGFVAVLIDSSLNTAEIIDHVQRAGSQYVICDERKAFCQELTEYGKTQNIQVLRFGDCEKIFSETPENFPPVPVAGDDVAVIVYTSGTTGKSKGVMLTNKNLMSGLKVSCYMGRRKRSHHYVTLAVLPFHHMFQVTTGIQCFFYFGITICIGKGIKYFSQSLKEFKPSIMVLVPLAVELMHKNIWSNVRKKDKEKALRILMAFSNGLRRVGIDLRRKLFKSLREELGGSLKTIIAGGAPLETSIAKDFQSWGIDVFVGYGITECSPVVACNRPEIRRDLSVGKPAPASFYNVKIENGEIMVRGDVVMKGYYNDPKQTQEAFADGWFRTGDLGHLDEKGFLHITGRIKNLIILPNGENVSAEELENIFITIDGIKDVLVTERVVKSGKVLAAIVVPEDEIRELGVDQLRRRFEPEFERLSAALPSYKRVYRVEVRLEDFLKSSSLKVKRIPENYELWEEKS